MMSMGQQSDTPMTIVKAVHQVNQRQRERFAKKIIDRFAGTAKAPTLAVWGLAFKAKTDDIRESPAISAIQMFLEEGMTVRAHDPAAMPNAVAELNGHIQTFDDCYEALTGADALVIFTDWQEFRTPDFELIRDTLKNPLIFDGRNLYDPAYVAGCGIEYHCIGRPVRKPKI